MKYKQTLQESYLTVQWLADRCSNQKYGRNEFDCWDLDLLEMANIPTKVSGLEYSIFISSKYAVHGRHGPRVKVSNKKGRFDGNDNFVITIPDLYVIGTPTLKSSEIDDIKDWIRLNRKLILKYWENGDEDLPELYLKIKKI